MQLAAVEYLNISGLVIDFATSPVRTGNSFFVFNSTNHPVGGCQEEAQHRTSAYPRFLKNNSQFFLRGFNYITV